MFPTDKPILVVDDMEVVRKVIRSELTRGGYTHIEEATNGDQALQMIEKASKSKPFQLIFLDWNMPVVTGIDLLKKLRANPSTKLLPVIMVTAESELDNVMEAIQTGVNSYLIQPIEEGQIAEKMEQVWKKISKR